MVFDRGSIKWASLMLPEHVKALREWRDNQKHPKEGLPLFDDQTSEMLDRRLQDALRYHRPVALSYIEKGERRTVRGIIQKLDPLAGTVILIDAQDQKHAVSATNIVDIN
ncbi:YolD-like family protein [Camelliibacillus cellulosilyticus]|uniref:YolD-like family protein n=1 Tax=Camelliibacillus cellulosilyticus TaxID=2174486 RepID=A0ABV9GHY1_9BACL